MDFKPSKGDPDVWMRLNKEHDVYEYIAVYVDDLAIVLKNPESFCKILKEKYNYKLKGTGPIEYHLGMDFKRDSNGNLTCVPKKYIEKSLAAYQRMFGELPREYTLPLEKGDHPEIDDSPELDDDGKKRYQSLIGTLQWMVSIGRLDIATAVMTLSKFRAAPREGHLERAKRIFGYVRKFDNAKITIRTDEPDYSQLPDQEYDWMYSVYGNVKELVPHDMPEPKGKRVIASSFVDANLHHDLVTGRAVTGILHM